MSGKTLLCSLGAAAVVGSLLYATIDGRAENSPQLPIDSGRSIITTLHAEGVQIYECRPGASGGTAWQFREPLATLMSDGKTVGRHFAGPTWELADGSSVVGKVSAQAAGATKSDIPLLRLDVMDRHGSGIISAAAGVARVNTHGGVFSGACDHVGSIHLEPYSADYVFSKNS